MKVNRISANKGSDIWWLTIIESDIIKDQYLLMLTVSFVILTIITLQNFCKYRRAMTDKIMKESTLISTEFYYTSD